MSSAPSWPDPNVISQIANSLFQAPPNQQPGAAPASPGIAVVPPSPTLTPAPAPVTAVAPHAPVASPYGTPDIPPTTIPSYAPTPNLSTPPAPSLAQTGFAAFPLTDVPQPGASSGSYNPGFAPEPDLGPLVALALGLPDGGSPAGALPQSGGSFGAGEQGFPSPSPGAVPSYPPALEVPSAAGLEALPSPAAAPGGTLPKPDDLYFLSESALGRAASQTAVPAPEPTTPKPSPAIEPAPAVPATASLSTAQPVPATGIGLGVRPFDPYSIRREFPILQEKVNGRPLVWLDNAATTQKPRAVIDRLSYFYEHENSNIHRAAHELAARATDAYEKARDSVRRFLNAPSSADIVFVRGTTEAINLVAQSWGRKNIGPGDEIVITWLEHHANIVPWQLLCTEKGAHLKVVPVDDSGQVLLDAYERLIGPRTKLVSFTQVSNALGTVTPAKEMIEIAHRHGVPVLLDGAQSVSHMRVDVQALDADWFVFSGHKVFGPTGIGALYGKSGLLETMPPWQGGGNMIEDVTFEQTRFQPAPARFEAGTGNIADAVGLGAALDYISAIGMENVARHEHELLLYGTRLLGTVPGLRLIGTAAEKAGVLSFVIDGVPTEDIGWELNRDGIAVRSGHHCAQPILRRFGLEATVRPSLAVYNTHEDIDALCASLQRIVAERRGNRR